MVPALSRASGEEMVELLDRVILRRPAETVLGRLRSSLHCAWIEVTRSQLAPIGKLSSSMGLKPRLIRKKACVTNPRARNFNERNSFDV